MDKKRVIVDYKNITQELLQLLTDTYPDGWEDDVIRFNNAKGESVSAVPLETEETKYLIKVGVGLDRRVEAFLDDDDDEEDVSSNDINIDEDEIKDDE